MKTAHTHSEAGAASRDRLHVTGANRRTLAAIFRHPSARNLEWGDVVALMEKIGEVQENSNGEFAFKVAGERHLMRRPHTKDLTGSEVIDLRQFLVQAGWSPEQTSQSSVHPGPVAPSLMIVVDHRGVKIFHFDVTSDDASKHVIKPYDPHHFLDHRAHKDQSRERAQRVPEDSAFYEKIADAVATGGKIVVVGHGTGKSNAAHHLTEYLRSHHRDTYRRVVREIAADLSRLTTPQLLELAQQALR